MASLYELTGDFAKFAEIVEQEDLSEEMREQLTEALGNLTEDIEEKLEGYAKVIKNFESDIKGLKEEEERLALKRKTLENRIKVMKEAMSQAMTATGKTKIKGTLFSFTLQKSPPKVVLEESYLENIPEAFLIPQEPQINKKLIKEVLEGDDLVQREKLEGIAHLEQSELIRIR